MKNTNVIIFSSGVSERRGLLQWLRGELETFDFAVLICEGHDKVQMLRDGCREETNSMRDNVLFEIIDISSIS